MCIWLTIEWTITFFFKMYTNTYWLIPTSLICHWFGTNHELNGASEFLPEDTPSENSAEKPMAPRTLQQHLWKSNGLKMNFLWKKRGWNSPLVSGRLFKVCVETNKTQEKQFHGLSVDGGGCDSTAFSWESFLQGWPVPVLHWVLTPISIGSSRTIPPFSSFAKAI